MDKSKPMFGPVQELGNMIAFQKVDDKAPLEKALHPELLKSERARVYCMVGLYLFFLTLSLVFTVLVAGWLQQFRDLPPPPTLPLAVLCLVVMGYESLVLQLLKKCDKERLILPNTFRYGNTVLEVSFVSAVLSVFALSYPPFAALNSPGIMAYGILILLSVLRLDFRLSVWTGVVSAAEFAGLSVYFLPPGGWGRIRSSPRCSLSTLGKPSSSLSPGRLPESWPR